MGLASLDLGDLISFLGKVGLLFISGTTDIGLFMEVRVYCLFIPFLYN